MKILKAEGFAGERSIVLPNTVVNDVIQTEPTNSLYVARIGYYPTAKYHYREREHGAIEYILIYCVNGKGWYEIDGRKYKVVKDEFFVLPEGVRHRYGADIKDPWTIYWIHFAGQKAGEFYSLHDKTLHQPRRIAVHPDRISLFDDIFQILSMGYSNENLMYANTCIWHLLGGFFFPDQFALLKNVGGETSINKLIYFMKRNLGCKLDLEDLAEESCFSASHLSLIFKRSTGYSPVSYFTQLKIQRACQYLDHTSMEIKEISAALGYDDPLYFSRVFRKIMDQSPKQYRKRPKG